MVNCGAPRYTNRTDKNSNIITLFTKIILLQLYRGIFRTLAYLLPEAYSKLCQIFKMMEHVEGSA